MPTPTEIKKLGKKAIAIKCDVTKKEDVDQTVKMALDTFGKVDILVNNVGWDNIVFFVKTTPDFWDKVIDMAAMAEFGTISLDDLELVYRTDSVDDAFDYITRELSGEPLKHPGGYI